MNEEYFQIAPMMRAYLSVGRVFSPYVMESDPPDIVSSHFSTDQYGFRTTIYQDAPLTLQLFNDPIFDGRRAAFVGNSTGFGVGATSDAKTIPSTLNQISSCAWFNFSGRTYNSTQELIRFMLFSSAPVDRVVIFSGVNNFDTSYRWFNDSSVYLPPFYSQAIYLSGLRHYFYPPAPLRQLKGLRRKVGRIVNRLSRKKPSTSLSNSEFFSDAIQQRLFSHTQDLDCLIESPTGLQRSLQRLEIDMQRWAALVGQNGGTLTFILQPIPEWTCKQLSPEEEQLLTFVKEQRGPTWEKISNFLIDKGTGYRREIEKICRRNGIGFYDANTLPFFQDEQWIFLDRYHLTDRGQALMAQFIADQVID